MVILVEQHMIKGSDPRFKQIDAAAFAAKNLYNLGNFTIRQSWLFGDGYIPFAQLYHRLKGTDAYRALPRKVCQQVLMQLDQNGILLCQSAVVAGNPAARNGCGA
jgi:putative transposase